MYGLALALQQTPLRIMEFPPRLVLIIACLIIPLVNLIALIRNNNNVARWAVVASTALWSVIGVLYGVHPTPNGGWVLTIAIIGFSFISLYEDGGGA